MLRTFLAAAICLAPGVASAHAFLDHAVPAVGATVSQAPPDLELVFTESVVPALSGVRVTSASGATIATGKLVAEAGEPATVRVRLGQALAPGAYRVHWHVVATDTHPTSGTYTFTVAP